EGYKNLVLVDDFSKTAKEENLNKKSYLQRIERENFPEWMEKNIKEIDLIFHIGARTDTAEFDKEVFDKLNLNFTKNIWQLCAQYYIPLVYASSAATYGLGEHGYEDRHDIVNKLKPLNAYGESKNDFDKWALNQRKQPPFWAGMKFFNVYGPNEYHKGRMASVIFHAYHQINNTDKVKLFRSHRDDFKDGEQLRDFIYVKDVVDVLFFMMEKQPKSGLYNLGTGNARSFNALAKSTFAALDKDAVIEYIDTPEDIRDKYQYFTEAGMIKLRNAGYKNEFHSLEKGVDDYVRNYLIPEKYL
ncbi:MAG TPA: ADP-glyceromanno-heptose 6-epimerase, partial [Bacteroidales bacterium]|nr:ADP-glyceromanno-heptose 6-epimerase [Bacteroidales bacterium]